MTFESRTLCLLAAVALSACATPSTPAPIVSLAEPAASQPVAASQPAAVVAVPVLPPPVVMSPQPAIVLAPSPVPVAPPPVLAPAVDGRVLLDKLLPQKIADRAGWATDIHTAFSALQIPQTPEYFCAALAVIEQESTWQGDPAVPGLGDIVWKEIGARAGKYHIPLFTVKAALMVPSIDGRSYKARIDALRTEREMNELFEAIVKDSPDLAKRFGITNPIRTGGPMQVSIEFALAHTKVWEYPYPIKHSIRDEVFTRRGGTYFGIAHLLQYRAPYQDMRYRFADFNAGRYSSRNAAFQLALAKLTKTKLVPDGDLLIYRDGRPSGTRSSTEKALLAIAGKLGMSAQEIAADLAREKTSGFADTRLYQRVFTLADQQAGRKVSREAMPQIRLQSSKITRKLTTGWFADRVNGRYQTCLARAR